MVPPHAPKPGAWATIIADEVALADADHCAQGDRVLRDFVVAYIVW